MQITFLVNALLLASTPLLSAADPAAAFRPWSSFETIDVRALSGGKIVTSVNASMDTDRGLSAQAAYVVPAPVDQVTHRLLTFDPSKHEGLGSFQHHLFRNENDAEFDRLKLDPRLPEIAALLKAIRARKGLQLSKAETLQFPAASSNDAMQPFLAGILRQRWRAFAENGDLGGMGTMDTRTELRSIIAQEPKIAAHFSKLLAPVTVKGHPAAPKFHYWDLADVNKTAAIDLGALYSGDHDGPRQVMDLTYYASSGYHGAITLYEFVPFTMGDREQTLVWQGCIISSSEVSGGFGIKRKIASRVLISDLEKWIRIFQREAARGTL